MAKVKTLQIRIHDVEYKDIRREAKAKGLSVSDYCRYLMKLAPGPPGRYPANLKLRLEAIEQAVANLQDTVTTLQQSRGLKEVDDG